MIKFATVRLGKTSVDDIKRINTLPSGILSSPIIVPVICTQVPLELETNTIIFLWFGSDNAKGMPTEWKQGFKAVGTVVEIIRGASFNSETTTKIRIEYVFSEAINRLDILRDASSAYFNCANLPIIGIDDHSNQTIRIFDEKQEMSDSHAFLYALNMVRGSFKSDICQIHPELKDYFCYFDKRLEKYIGQGNSHNQPDTSIQVIYYGAPGTGKSHEVKEKTGELLENGKEVDLPNVFRTTFHPDTDYAAFVGCYKPCMVSKEPIFDSIALKSKLLEIKNEGGGYACHKFGYKYWESLDRLSANEIKDILHVGGFSDNMAVEVQKGIALAEKFHNETSQIAYTFVPQVFTDAYVYAYSNPTEQTYLVIEEINRGNCAQIFGDLFQLLDRKDGKSDYKIKADKDLAKYLADNLGADSEGIKDGKLCLPANLHILATMNTSDQSLFPMDSAFKRRWEWEYVPINYGTDVQSGEFEITIGEKKYPWDKFIEKVNEKIFALTQSEDKQMGNFFIKHSIDDKGFKSKVMFYLWYEVLRDETENNKYFFYGKTTVDGKEVLSKFTFKDLYTDKATETLQQFMEYLGVASK